MTLQNEWLIHFIFKLEDKAYQIELHSVNFIIDYEFGQINPVTDIYYHDPIDISPNLTYTNLDIYRLSDKDGIWSVILFRESWKNWNGTVCESCEIEIEGDYRKFKGWLAMFKLQNMDMDILWNTYDWPENDDINLGRSGGVPIFPSNTLPEMTY